MTYEGKKELVLFEDDRILQDLVQKYYILLDEVTRKRLPPGESMFMKMFSDRYKIILDEEEFVELKDYAENEFTSEIPLQIQSDFESGRITKIM
ncbi:MAG: hypothetical protein ACM34K_18345 [Bacillota bacterium]